MVKSPVGKRLIRRLGSLQFWILNDVILSFINDDATKNLLATEFAWKSVRSYVRVAARKATWNHRMCGKFRLIVSVDISQIARLCFWKTQQFSQFFMKFTFRCVTLHHFTSSIIAHRGVGRPRGFWHFLEAWVKFPNPGHLVKVKFPISPLKFPTQETILDVKIPTLGELHDVKLPWVAPHPGA